MLMNSKQNKLLRLLNAFSKTVDATTQNEYVLNHLNLSPGESVLEVGCGIGYLCKIIANIVGPTGNVIGVDISQLIISMAKENNHYQWLDFRQGDAMNLDIQESTINALICIQLAEYLPKVDSFLLNAYRVLNNNGRAVIVTTDWKSLVWSNWNIDNTSKWLSHCHDPMLYSNLKNKLIQAGFQNIDVEKIRISNVNYSTSSYSYYLSAVIQEYMVLKNIFSQEEGSKWISGLVKANEAGNYHFSLDRYIFSVKK